MHILTDAEVEKMKGATARLEKATAAQAELKAELERIRKIFPELKACFAEMKANNESLLAAIKKSGVSLTIPA